MCLSVPEAAVLPLLESSTAYVELREETGYGALEYTNVVNCQRQRKPMQTPIRQNEPLVTLLFKS